MKNIFSVLLILLFFSSCQKEPLFDNQFTPNAPLIVTANTLSTNCNFNLSFSLNYSTCFTGITPPGGGTGFTFRFISEDGIMHDFDYSLPNDFIGNYNISLPSGKTYNAYVLNNGTELGCTDPIYFDITIRTAKTQEVCGVISTVIDQRPEACCLNPEATFTLSEKCIGCTEMEIREPVLPYECCFDYSITPKWFPSCFGDCFGNFDNVVELHHAPCSTSTLPPGWTSTITGIVINNPNATFGNCSNCEEPITTFPNGQGGANSTNLAVCSPGSHSVLIDVTIFNAFGQVVDVCENNYYSFTIDDCL